MFLHVLAGVATTLLGVTANLSNITLADLNHNNDTSVSYNETQVWSSKTICNSTFCDTLISYHPCCKGKPRPLSINPTHLHRKIPHRLARAAQAPPTYQPPRPPPVDPIPPWPYPPPRPPPVDPTPPWPYPPPRPRPVDPTPPWIYPPPRPRPVDPTPPWTYPPPRPPPVDPTPPWKPPPSRPPPVDPTPPWIYPPPRPPPIYPTPPWPYPPPQPPPWIFPPGYICLPTYPICTPTYQPTPVPTRPTYPPTPPPTYPPPDPCCYVCPSPPTTCPYGYGKRRRRDNRLTKRQCHIDTQCPEKFSCCNNVCLGKDCKKSHFNSTTSVETTEPMKKQPTQKWNGTRSDDNSIAYQQPKVIMTILFTSASQDAAIFLRDYLLPFMYNLNDYIELQLVPYGKVKENGECEYGYGDCLGNWMIACASRFLPGQLSTLRFATCLMTADNHRDLLQGNFPRILNAAKECAKDYPEKIRGIHECGVGEQGFSYFLESARYQYAMDHSITEIPTVALDGQIVVRGSSEVNLLPKFICEKLKVYPEAKWICDQIFLLPNV